MEDSKAALRAFGSSLIIGVLIVAIAWTGFAMVAVFSIALVVSSIMMAAMVFIPPLPRPAILPVTQPSARAPPVGS